MRTCPTCHNPLSDQAVFCDNCGLSLQPVVTGAPVLTGGNSMRVQSQLPLLSLDDKHTSGWVSPAIPANVYPARNVVPGACPVCGQVNGSGEVFCGNCGIELTGAASIPVSPQPMRAPLYSGTAIPAGAGGVISDRCPSCGHTNLPAVKFCDNCGISLQLTPDQSSIPLNFSEIIAQNVSPSPGMSGASPELVSQLRNTAPGMCAACGYVNASGEMFCQNCGVQLAPVVSIPPPPPVLISSQPSAGYNPDGVYPPVSPGLVPPQVVGSVQGIATGLDPWTAGPVHVQPRMGVPPGLPAVNPSLPVSSYRPGEIVITGRLAVRATNVSVPLPVGKNEITVGRIDPARNAFPDIDLTPYQGESAGVSRLHARLIIGVGEANSGGQLFIEDLQSTNGTLVNKQKLQAGQRIPLKNGDEIRFGRIAVEIYFAFNYSS